MKAISRLSDRASWRWRNSPQRKTVTVNVTAVAEYPTKSRATKGVISIKVTERNGLVVGAVQVDDCDQIMNDHRCRYAGTYSRFRNQHRAVTPMRDPDPYCGRLKRSGSAACC
ncbi:hypothetical protein ACULNC_15430 [Shigella flexneri]